PRAGRPGARDRTPGEADVPPRARARVRGSRAPARRDRPAEAWWGRSRVRPDSDPSLISCRAGDHSAILPPLQARSSVVEHYVDIVVVAGSIPAAPTRPDHRCRISP